MLVAVGGTGIAVGGTAVGVLVLTTVGVFVGTGAAGAVVAVGVGAAFSPAAWPKLARNTEKAISMARNCLTA